MKISLSDKTIKPPDDNYFLLICVSDSTASLEMKVELTRRFYNFACERKSWQMRLALVSPNSLSVIEIEVLAVSTFLCSRFKTLLSFQTIFSFSRELTKPWSPRAVKVNHQWSQSSLLRVDDFRFCAQFFFFYPITRTDRTKNGSSFIIPPFPDSNVRSQTF